MGVTIVVLGGGESAVQSLATPLPESPVVGTSPSGTGVTGLSNKSVGVWGACYVDALTPGTGNSDGVFGYGKNGVHGQSYSPTESGVWGENPNGGYGVCGSTKIGSAETAGVWGDNSGAGPGVKATGAAGPGILASSSSGLAGDFKGDVHVGGTLTVDVDICLPAMDCAEEFEIDSGADAAAGSVMVLGDDGALQPSTRAYDTKVVGVISGAGSYRPGIILGRVAGTAARLPIALAGKVFCQVDAEFGAVEVGDLLTTSPTTAHAMKASDPSLAFGAVIGKALRCLREGRGLIPMLVALQ